MATKFNDILNKDIWTGDEVGKMVVFSLIDSYKQTLNGVKIPKELFSVELLNKMLSLLNDSEQTIRYHRYVGLNHWIMQFAAIANTNLIEASGRLGHIMSIISVAAAIENHHLFIEKAPIIMTQKQYDETSEHEKNKAKNGIAIIRHEDINNSSIVDKNGYYINSEFSNIGIICGLEQFTKLNDDYMNHIELIQDDREVILDDYYSVLGYNTAIELIAEYIDMPEFLIFKANDSFLSNKIEKINNLIETLKFDIENIEYNHKQNNHLKSVKLKVIEDYFQPIDWKSLKIPAKAINKAKSMLTDNMKAFEAQDAIFYNTLATRGFING